MLCLTYWQAVIMAGVVLTMIVVIAGLWYDEGKAEGRFTERHPETQHRSGKVEW
jgi:hypothetical protein